MDKEQFVRDLLSDPETAIKAYREGGYADAELEELIQQVSRLNARLEQALDVPAPSGLAADIIENVQANERERLVFERALMTEPDEALANHDAAAADSISRSMADEARRFENTLARALAVEAPAGLPQRLGDHVQKEGKRRRSAPWMTAVAASVFAIIGIALIVAPRPGEAAKLRQAFIDHTLHDEPGAMTSFDIVEDARVAELFLDFGAETTESFGQVHYARKCPIGDAQGAHIVMQRNDGPVTFLFVPEKALASMQTFDVEGGITGRMFPLANGVGALFGHQGQSLEELDQVISGAFERTIAATLGLKVAGQG